MKDETERSEFLKSSSTARGCYHQVNVGATLFLAVRRGALRLIVENPHDLLLASGFALVCTTFWRYIDYIVYQPN